MTDKDTSTIAQQLSSFKKHLWSSQQPLDFSSDVVFELLMEIQRQKTVMLAALDEVDRMWVAHEKLAEENGDIKQLVNLMDSLRGIRKGFYPQYLSPSEYEEFIKRSTSLEMIAMMQGEGEE